MKLCSKSSPGMITALIIGIVIALISADAFGQTLGDRANYEREGEGRAVVFIPGLTSSGDVFREAGSALTGTENHYVTLHGFAGLPAPSDLEAFTQPAAHDVAAYLEEQDLSDVLLVGHSMGGVISLLVAAEHSDRVSEILIIDSVPFLAGLGDPNADPDLVAQRKPMIQSQFASMSEEQFLAMMRQGLPVQATSPASQERVWQDVSTSDQDAVAIAAAEIFSGDYSAVLPDIEANITVLVPYNEYAQVSPEDWRDRYAALYDGATHLDVRIVEDSRHFIMLDQPEVFADVLIEIAGGSGS